MVDVSRRGFLALLGVAAAAVATRDSVLAIERLVPPEPQLLAIRRPPPPPICSDCFLAARGKTLPLGRLLDARVVSRSENAPTRSGASGRGRVMRPVHLSVVDNTTVWLQTRADLTGQEAFLNMRVLGDVGFLVRTSLGGERIELACAHATPTAVAWAERTSVGGILEFELTMVDLVASRHPLEVIHVG